MARISAYDLHVHLPVFNFHSQSLKKTALRAGTGGRIHADAKAVMIEALRAIDFEIEDGDRIGLIGPNGAGKTTLLRTLAGVYHPTAGTLEIEGRLVPMLSVGIGMYEDASGYENIRNLGVALGMMPEEIEAKYDEIAAFTELGEYLELPVYTYSAGMRTRLSFAVATAIEAEILLLDEVISAGDASFVHKASARFRQLLQRTRILVLASHSPQWIAESCNKAMLLVDGRIADFGDVDSILRAYEAMAAA